MRLRQVLDPLWWVVPRVNIHRLRHILQGTDTMRTSLDHRWSARRHINGHCGMLVSCSARLGASLDLVQDVVPKRSRGRSWPGHRCRISRRARVLSLGEPQLGS